MGRSERAKSVVKLSRGSWNYRVMVESDGVKIVEAYYDDKGEIWGHRDAVVVGNDTTDLKGELQNMLLAFERPFLLEDNPNER